MDPNEDNDVHIDDNVDQLFEEKMRKLRELGLYDDRMMSKVNLIKDMTSSNVQIPRSHLKRGYKVLGRPDTRSDYLEEFKGDDMNEETGETGFTPISGNGLKWSLPISNKKWRPRDKSPPNRSSSPQTIVDPYNDKDREWARTWNRINDSDIDRERDSDKERERLNDSNRDRMVDSDRDRKRDRDRDRDRERQSDRYREKDRHNDRYNVKREVKVESELSSNGIKDDLRTKTEFSNDSNSRSNESIDKKRYCETDVYKPSTSTSSLIKEESNKKLRFNIPNIPTNEKPTNFHKFFESRKSKPEEKKTETITDIEAFIRDCNKKAEKPRPLIIDDIDDYIEKANKRFNEISAKLDKEYE